MRLCLVRGVEVRIHPLVLIVLAGACVLGRLEAFLQALLALLLHETSHVVIAASFGCTVESVELQPFGGVARLKHARLLPQPELCIAAAGPVTSFVTAGVAAACVYLFPRTAYRLEPFLVYNLALGGVNLIPALPLDGGRILRAALLSRCSEQRATRFAASLGVAAGAGMIALFLFLLKKGVENLTLPVMGAFLLMAAAGELLRMPEKRLEGYFSVGDRIREGGDSAVHHVAAHASMTAAEALRILRFNRYNLLRVVDSGMRTVGELDEGALLTGIARGGYGATLGEILSFDRG